MTEWRDIPGWEGCYQASDTGLVRSVDRIVARSTGPFKRKGQILTGTPDVDGKLCVWLRRAQHPSRHEKVCVLVLEAFVGPRPEHMVCCHYDDVPTNDNLENLRWDTHASNHADCVRNGLHHLASKTQCPKNHPYDEVNTYIQPSNGSRICRICRRISNRERKRVLRAAERAQRFVDLNTNPTFKESVGVLR